MRTGGVPPGEAQRLVGQQGSGWWVAHVPIRLESESDSESPPIAALSYLASSATALAFACRRARSLGVLKATTLLPTFCRTLTAITRSRVHERLHMCTCVALHSDVDPL